LQESGNNASAASCWLAIQDGQVATDAEPMWYAIRAGYLAGNLADVLGRLQAERGRLPSTKKTAISRKFVDDAIIQALTGLGRNEDAVARAQELVRSDGLYPGGIAAAVYAALASGKPDTAMRLAQADMRVLFMGASGPVLAATAAAQRHDYAEALAGVRLTCMTLVGPEYCRESPAMDYIAHPAVPMLDDHWLLLEHSLGEAKGDANAAMAMGCAELMRGWTASADQWFLYAARLRPGAEPAATYLRTGDLGAWVIPQPVQEPPRTAN
jgi:hypothetical protein